MKERPILFSAPMVSAIREDRKIMTRRVIKPQPVQPAEGSYFDAYNKTEQWNWWNPDGRQFTDQIIKCPYGKPGDRLWVRETWQPCNCSLPECHGAIYRADGEPAYLPGKWRPSIFMPRWASRITLEITNVRVERLNDISEDDAICEGIEGWDIPTGGDDYQDYWRNYMAKGEDQRVLAFEGKPIDSFRTLWESINGAGSWDANPWVWIVEFKRIEVNNER